MAGLTTIGLDADDTLWHNEHIFRMSQQRFCELLADHAAPDHLSARLLEAERRNLGHYGYGVKSFTLSMIETALEITGGRVPGAVIGELIGMGREMLAHPVQLLPGVAETLDALHGRYSLVLITMGDLLDQQRKLAQSGLGELFSAVEIVSEKRPETYRSAFSRHGSGAERALMVGNSMRSDILPALAAGAFAAHVPYRLQWALQEAEAPPDQPRLFTLGEISALPDLLERLG